MIVPSGGSSWCILETQRNPLADSRRRSLNRFKQHLVVVGIQEAVNLAAARMHPLCQLHFADAFFLHGLRNLPRQDTLHGLGGCLLKDALFLQEILEGRSDMFFSHRSISFL